MPYFGSRPPENALEADDIASNAVTTAKIANDAVDTDKINLVSTSSAPSLEAKGTSGQTEGYIQLNCAENSHGIKLKSPPHSAAQSYTLTFPSAIVDGGFMKTDSSGNLSFAAVSSDFVKIQSTTASGANEIEFTSSHFSNSTYSSYEFRFLNLKTNSDGDTFYAKTSTDGGSTFDTGYDFSVMESNTNAGTDYTDVEAENNNFIQLTTSSNVGSATNESLSGRFYLFNPGATEYTHSNWHISYQDDQAGVYWTNAMGSARRLSAADVDGIKFEYGTGTITGTIIMYGVK